MPRSFRYCGKSGRSLGSGSAAQLLQKEQVDRQLSLGSVKAGGCQQSRWERHLGS